MFARVLVSTRRALAVGQSSTAVGAAITVAVAAALVSAKTTPFTFAATLCAAIIAAGNRRQFLLYRVGPAARSTLFFLAYALTSSAWSVDTQLSLQTVGIAGIVALGALVLGNYFDEEVHACSLQMGTGLWIGFAGGLVYLLIETLSDQGIKVWIYNAIGLAPGDLNPQSYFTWSQDRLTSISPDDLKHSIAPIPLFLWSALLTLLGAFRARWRLYAAASIVILAHCVVLLSTHGTSKAALIAGTSTFGCAFCGPRLAVRLVSIGWVFLCLAVLPAALVLHRMDLHNSERLAPSARHRLIIWNFTAERALSAPTLGIGANATYVLGPRLEATTVSAPDEAYPRTLSRHSHDVYLQTWLELGIVGATLLCLAGISVLSVLSTLPIRMQPFGYATFVSAAVMAAASYGMWQLWFLCLYAFCAALFVLGHASACKGGGFLRPSI
jgi:hypothetical protein